MRTPLFLLVFTLFAASNSAQAQLQYEDGYAFTGAAIEAEQSKEQIRLACDVVDADECKTVFFLLRDTDSKGQIRWQTLTDPIDLQREYRAFMKQLRKKRSTGRWKYRFFTADNLFAKLLAALTAPVIAGQRGYLDVKEAFQYRWIAKRLTNPNRTEATVVSQRTFDKVMDDLDMVKPLKPSEPAGNE